MADAETKRAEAQKREIEQMLFGRIDEALVKKKTEPARGRALQAKEDRRSSGPQQQQQREDDDADEQKKRRRGSSLEPSTKKRDPEDDEDDEEDARTTRRASLEDAGTRFRKRRSASLKPKRRSSSLQPMTSDTAEALRREIAADIDALRPRSLRRETTPQKKTVFVKTKSKTVVVAGASGTGKTQAIETFVNGSTRLKPLPTMGVEAFDVPELRVWDTSGDERFDEATLGLLGVADAVVAFYDPRRPETLPFAASKLFASTHKKVCALVATSSGGGPSEEEEEDALIQGGQQLAKQLTAAEFSYLRDPTNKANVDALFSRISRRLDDASDDQHAGVAEKAPVTVVDPSFYAIHHLADHPDLLDRLQREAVLFFLSFLGLLSWSWLLVFSRSL